MHRSEMMKDSAKHHHAYYLQFSTPATRAFVLREIGVRLLKFSKDPWFNDIIKHDRGGAGNWIWDFAPINTSILKSRGEVDTVSTRTCVSKAVAREILRELSAE